MKRKAKTTEADRKREIFLTGDGTVSLSGTHNMLLGIMVTAALGLQNIFDGDKPGNFYLFL